ncbi:MAG: glutamate synthase large subunit, partial [Phycisphaerales bacterium]|nr:glutamate synthase large subunit [Phycisphaerales bacterium]
MTERNQSTPLRPKDQGLYSRSNEHDACGVGAVVNINGEASHDILAKANEVIMNLHHRGAAGADNVTGDGGGVLFQLCDDFFRPVLAEQGVTLPDHQYGAGVVFLPQDDALRAQCESAIEKAAVHYGLGVIAWRDVPTDNSLLGEIALAAEPVIRQVFVDGNGLETMALERKLYVIRRRAELDIRTALPEVLEDFYINTLSCRTILYKGMFMAHQLFPYFPDLSDPRMKTAMALVHQRYSTNTFPNWKLAQPFRLVCHNGEINTLSGNRHRMKIREPFLASDVFGDDLADAIPVLYDEQSDSASFDQALELLLLSGRSLPHSLMMMMPEAFGGAYHMSTYKRAFYEYHASIMEPWDGPAAMLFTDGTVLGGTLDRNGLRPCRYTVTKDGLVVLGSESGVIEFPADQIVKRGRLQPGKMFLVDTEQGRIIDDNEIKGKISRQAPYRRWLNKNKIELRGLLGPSKASTPDAETLAQNLTLFGYTREELKMIQMPMAVNGQEPIGSMGNDAPLAVLSDQPKAMFNYFKQKFAQVTTPPIDPLREGLVMSLMSFTGKQHNLLTETPEHCQQLKLAHPILTNNDIATLKNSEHPGLNVVTIDMTFDATAADPAAALQAGIDAMLASAEAAIADGANILVLSDRNSSETRCPISSLLGCSAMHHGLEQRKLRGEVGLVIESGEPRETHHFCVLLGFGANAINPYLLFDVMEDFRQRGKLNRDDLTSGEVLDQIIAALKKGILKTMSKMGISTVRSYQYAQLFEAIGLNSDVVDAYFSGTASRIGGVGLGQIAADSLTKHAKGFHTETSADLIDFGGEYHVRKDGENHLWSAEAVAAIHQAVRGDDYDAYKRYATAINDQSRKHNTLRGLFEFVPGDSVPLDEVEPASEIVKRFCTGAMSYGSISKEAHETMCIAMNRLGGMSNTGEGGEDPIRYQPTESGDSLNSAIKQVASGRFGVTIEYLSQGKEIQIKMAQGAKPGEGGQLPGHKVSETIAKMRYSTPGVTLISPPPHHDIYSIEDLAQLIYDLKQVNPDARVCVKLVARAGIGTIAAGV